MTLTLGYFFQFPGEVMDLIERWIEVRVATFRRIAGYYFQLVLTFSQVLIREQLTYVYLKINLR